MKIILHRCQRSTNMHFMVERGEFHWEDLLRLYFILFLILQSPLVRECGRLPVYVWNEWKVLPSESHL